MGFLLGCFSVFKSWQLASPRPTDEGEGEGEEEGQGGGEGGKPQSFTILISTVTYYYFHPICWSQRPILVVLKGITGGHLGDRLQQNVFLDAHFL